MLFNSLEFALFLPAVFLIYWVAAGKSLRLQNIVLLLASYLFYSWWDYRFLFLLVFSTLLDYFSGIKIHEATSARHKKTWLLLNVIINVGFLGFFKYYNFFIDSFVNLLTDFGLSAHVSTLNIILPIGISFYTFHGLSYIFDIYNKKIEPTRNFTDYALFVGFFPLLVAGPIERATHLLPQIKSPRQFRQSDAADGLKQILWGLFKKVVIADNCATYANDIFNHAGDYHGSTLVIGALFFAFQIYGDFSGYSDIALGTARLLGFDLIRNFAFPYFSRDIAEFWRRWHVSLSSWFRDYLYIPLGGSKRGTWITIRNILITFVVSGFWHGANWTFVVWGALNGLSFLPLQLLNKKRDHLDVVAQGRLFPSVKELAGMIITFSWVVFGWIFFRAESITHALNYISGIFSDTLFSKPDKIDDVGYFMEMNALLIFFFMTIEWLGRERNYAIERLGARWPTWLRWSFYAFILFLIGMYMKTKGTPFIYFQF